jgi:hypothetical protein
MRHFREVLIGCGNRLRMPLYLRPARLCSSFGTWFAARRPSWFGGKLPGGFVSHWEIAPFHGARRRWVKRALGAIKAKAYVMPGQTDLYFPPEDSQFEVANMLNAKLLPVPSIWGHFAGGPGTNPADGKFIDDALKQLLSA